MSPSFDVALLCQTCQEREMDCYRGRSGIRLRWRGGAGSRLTAVINHLPASQMQVDRKGQDGWNGNSYTVYQRCLLASHPLVECCLSLIQLTSINQLLFQGQACMWHASFHFDVPELWHCVIDIFWANRLHLPEERKNCPSHKHHITAGQHIQAKPRVSKGYRSDWYLLK